MEYRTLGRTEIKVSPFGFGTGGGQDPLGQRGGMPEEDVFRLIRHAYEKGINFFDTAPGYMESEVLLGRALRKFPRDSYHISTKIALAGSMPGEPIQVMNPADIEKNVDKCLRRLDMDYVDLLLIAVADPDYYDQVVEQQLPELERLRKKGKIRFLGSSEQSRDDGSHQWLQKILPTGLLDVAMVSHNMVNQSARKVVFPVCKQMNLGAINIFTVRNAFRNPDYLAEVLQDLRNQGLLPKDFPENFRLDDWIREQEGIDLPEAAYRYAAFTEGVSLVMMGTLKPSRIDENFGYLEKGPLKESTLRQLHAWFGDINVPVGN